VAEAFGHMHTGRIRPAVLEAPWEVFGQSAEVDLDVYRGIPKPPMPDPDGIAAEQS
jgi:acetolactate synthase-1/2/3 large subunit